MIIFDNFSERIPHSKPYINNSDFKSVSQVLEAGMLAEGSSCIKVVNFFKDFFKCENVYLTNSGSSSLFAALKILDLSPDAEVILPSYVCKDVIEAIYLANLKPILCDIGTHWNVSYDSIKQKISPVTQAIIIPHVLGIQADMANIKELGILVIEDCCQCFGSSLNGTLAGSIGDICILSFNATKCLTSGEGGAIIINNKELAKLTKSQVSLMHVLRMSDLQAALCYSQCIRYHETLEIRKALANLYFKLLNPRLTSTFGEVKSASVYFRFLIYSDIEFEAFRKYMESKYISVRKGIDELLHQQYNLGPDEQFPNTVTTYQKTISLPLYPSLTTGHVERICDLTNKFYQNKLV